MKLTQKEKDIIVEAVETYVGLLNEEDLKKYGKHLDNAMKKIMEDQND